MMGRMNSRRQLPNAPLLQAINGTTPDRRPVWFMRQAGRSLPEYREIRKNIGMLDACFNPEITAEITLQPVRRHDVDAAIFFSDIVVPLKAAGIDVDIVAGRGPVVSQPVRDEAAVRNLPELKAGDLDAISEAITITREQLSDTQALIGFAGAPFTVASYLVEGGPSKNHVITKSMMHRQPQLWHDIMAALTPMITEFLQTQIDAGVDVIQLFDSWAGYLNAADYREFVAPYSKQIFDAVAETGIPRIHFGVTTGELLADMAATGPEVMGVDWRVTLPVGAQRVATHRDDPLVLQGNLDPALFFAGQDVMNQQVDRLVAESDALVKAGTIKGHIVNLGHGVLPDTDPQVITDTVSYIHSIAPGSRA